MKKIALLAVFALTCFFCGCKTPNGETVFTKEGYTTDKVDIEIGLDKPVSLLVINDLHMQVFSEEISSENVDFINNRIGEFSTNNLSTKERWNKLPKLINRCDSDYVLFLGDMLDFNSEATCNSLKEGFEKLKKPYMYIRSDHDMEPYWLTNPDNEAANIRQEQIFQQKGIYVEEFEEFLIMGVNLSQNNMTESALNTAKEVLKKGKPVIVVTHVPIGSLVDTSLKEYSEEIRQGRSLFWAPGADKEPNEVTKEFIDLITKDDSGVVAVLAAHLHGKWDGMLSLNVREHIFAPCYQGNVGIVNVY